MRALSAKQQRLVHMTQEQIVAGRLHEAIQTLRAGALAKIDAPEVRYLYLMLAIQLRRWQEALAMAEVLLAEPPNRLVVHLDRALCLIELGRLDEARAALEAADDIVMTCYVRDVLLARIAMQQHQPSRAITHIAQACRRDPAALTLAAKTPELVELLQRMVQTIHHALTAQYN
jgi:tetratricopeptide (TPR) repeat protein